MANKNRVRVTLTADGSDAEQAFRSLNKKMDRTQRQTKQTKRQFIELNQAASRMGNALRNTGLVVGTAATGLAYFSKRQLEAVEQMEDNAKMAGTTTQAYQELVYAGKQLGVTQSAITDGLKELNNRADEFVETGAGPAADAFERLNISQDELRGKLGNTSALFMELIDQMQDMDRAAQIRIADEIFGGQGGEQFVKLVRSGVDTVAGLRREANELGITLDDIEVQNAVEANREIKKLTSQLQSQFQKVLGELAPDLRDIADNMSDWVAANKTFLTQDVPGHAENIGDSLKTIKNIYDALPQEVVAAGGGGIVGRMLFGGRVGKWIALFAGINAALDRTGDSIGDIINNIQGVGQNFQNIIAGLQTDYIGQVDMSNVRGFSDEYLEKFRSANKLFQEASNKVEDLANVSNLELAQSFETSEGSLNQYLQTMKKANRQAEHFQNISFQGYEPQGGDGGGILETFLPESQMQAKVAQFDRTMNQLQQRRDDFFMQGGTGLSAGDIPTQWESIFDQIADGGKLAFDRLERSATDWKNNTADIINSAVNQFSATMAEFLTRGEADWREFGLSVIQTINQMIIKWLTWQAIKGVAGTFTGPGTGAGSASAQGNVFSGGEQLTQYAQGGIVTEPTVFPMRQGTGLMGEAGPEAVMPLTRTSEGDLGVKSADNGKKNQQEVNVKNINVLDPSIVGDYLNTDEGEQKIVNIMQKNQ